MRPNVRQGQILFIVIIDVLFLIAFSNALIEFFTKSYSTREQDLVLVDTVSFKLVSREIIPMTTASRRIELTAINSKHFRIWDSWVDGIVDKELFFTKLRDPKSRVLVYSDKKAADRYRKGISLFTTIKQLKIGNLNLIDLNKKNAEEKSIMMRELFIYPILAIIITLYFRYKLLT